MLDLELIRTNTATGTELEQQVTPESLFLYVNQMKAEGARFITITARDMGDKHQMIYHFEIDGKINNLYLTVEKDKPLPSITGLYGAAFIAENEVQDLFGQRFIAMNIDLGGKMLKIGPEVGTDMHKSVGGPQPPIKRFFGKCREECPAMVNIPRYLRQIADGDPEGAYNTIVEQVPFPALLGRVCFAPCQEGCRQQVEAKPIQIRLLKRYAADATREKLGGFVRQVQRKPSTGKRVAVIGGGPAGVAAAYHLGMLGHDVAVYEKRVDVGGATFWGIPKHRLPKDVLSEEMRSRLKEAGAKLVTGVEIDSIEKLFEGGYEAVYVAVGAEKCNDLRCEGEEAPGVIAFNDFLEAVNVRNETPDLGRNVIVIGGGNSAMDSARTAKRLGSDVTVYYRRTEEEMPALLEEIHEAMREGISFEFLTSQIVIHPGKPLRIEFQLMIPGEPDESGRRRPMPMEGRSVFREADTIIKAIGSQVNVPMSFGLKVDRQGRIVVDEGYSTSMKGVFAGGDAVFGTANVVQAMRDARKAASAIDKYLGGEGLAEPAIDMGEFINKPANRDELIAMERVEASTLPAEERIKSFDEVEMCLMAEKALREATRCWRCDWNE